MPAVRCKNAAARGKVQAEGRGTESAVLSSRPVCSKGDAGVVVETNATKHTKTSHGKIRGRGWE